MPTNNIPDDTARFSALDAAHRSGRKSKQASSSSQPRPGSLIAFSYLRVSTKEQARTGGGAEGYSIPAQRDACHTKGDQLNATVVREYVDAGESARSADRDELQRMLRDIKTVKPGF